MPHQCTNCGRGFADGSKEMLSGCPDCGGNKFQFQPDNVDSSTPPDAEPPDPPEPQGNSVARTVGKTAATVRDIVGSDEPAPQEPSAEVEDSAQASARGDVVSPDELPSNPQADGDTEHRFQPVDSEPAPSPEPDEQDRPDLDELREELNDQFESIKVLEPGQYELNLMELYDREEYIVALQEDGRYSIQVPETIGE